MLDNLSEYHLSYSLVFLDSVFPLNCSEGMVTKMNFD